MDEFGSLALGYWIARALMRSSSGVRLGDMDEEGIAVVSAEASIVFVMKHRTVLDHARVSYLSAWGTTVP